MIASQLVVIGQSASSDGQLVVIASQPASRDNLKLVCSRTLLIEVPSYFSFVPSLTC